MSWLWEWREMERTSWKCAQWGGDDCTRQAVHLASSGSGLNHGNWRKWCLSKWLPKENGEGPSSKHCAVNINASFIQKQWSMMGRAQRQSRERLVWSCLWKLYKHRQSPKNLWEWTLELWNEGSCLVIHRISCSNLQCYDCPWKNDSADR